MTARRYPFEGELRTVAEILAMMPVYSERSVRGYLADENPPTTRAEMHEMARRAHGQRPPPLHRRTGQGEHSEAGRGNEVDLPEHAMTDPAKISAAATLLEAHNRWRRDGAGEMVCVRALGEAIDLAVSVLRERGSPPVKVRTYDIDPLKRWI